MNNQTVDFVTPHLNFTFLFFTALFFIPFILLMWLVNYCLQKSRQNRNRVEEDSTIHFFKIKDEPLNGLCHICQGISLSEEEDIIVLSCGHEVHFDCISDWYTDSKDNNCPVCREASE